MKETKVSAGIYDYSGKDIEWQVRFQKGEGGYDSRWHVYEKTESGEVRHNGFQTKRSARLYVLTYETHPRETK